MRVKDINVDKEKILYVKYIPISVKTIWPAVMLAASRKLSVIGRTEILVVSIRTKNGFNQLGAPPGRRAAAQEDGFDSRPEIIRDSQIGRPITRVKERCLVRLKIYGTKPNRFKIISVENRGASREERPLRLKEDVRLNCSHIKLVGISNMWERRDGFNHRGKCVRNRNSVHGRMIG